jgi:hypothetical protein
MERDDHSFSILVQSDACKSLYPRNWSNNFTVRLPRPIMLDGEWEFALTELHFPLMFEFHSASPFHQLHQVHEARKKFVQTATQKLYPPKTHVFYPKQHWERGEKHKLYEIPTDLIVTDHKRGHLERYDNLWVRPSLAEGTRMNPEGNPTEQERYKQWLRRYNLDQDHLASLRIIQAAEEQHPRLPDVPGELLNAVAAYRAPTPPPPAEPSPPPEPLPFFHGRAVDARHSPSPPKDPTPPPEVESSEEEIEVEPGIPIGSAFYHPPQTQQQEDALPAVGGITMGQDAARDADRVGATASRSRRAAAPREIDDFSLSHELLFKHYKGIYFDTISDPRNLTDEQIVQLLDQHGKMNEKADSIPHHWTAEQIEIAERAVESIHPGHWYQLQAQGYLQQRSYPPYSQLSDFELLKLQNEPMEYYENDANPFFMSREQVVTMTEEYMRRGKKFPSFWTTPKRKYAYAVYFEDQPLRSWFFSQPDIKLRIARFGIMPVPRFFLYQDPRKWSRDKIYHKGMKWNEQKVNPEYGNVPSNWSEKEKRHFKSEFLAAELQRADEDARKKKAEESASEFATFESQILAAAEEQTASETEQEQPVPEPTAETSPESAVQEEQQPPAQEEQPPAAENEVEAMEVDEETPLEAAEEVEQSSSLEVEEGSPKIVEEVTTSPPPAVEEDESGGQLLVDENPKLWSPAVLRRRVDEWKPVNRKDQPPTLDDLPDNWPRPLKQWVLQVYGETMEEALLRQQKEQQASKDAEVMAQTPEQMYELVMQYQHLAKDTERENDYLPQEWSEDLKRVVMSLARGHAFEQQRIEQEEAERTGATPDLLPIPDEIQELQWPSGQVRHLVQPYEQRTRPATPRQPTNVAGVSPYVKLRQIGSPAVTAPPAAEIQPPMQPPAQIQPPAQPPVQIQPPVQPPAQPPVQSPVQPPAQIQPSTPAQIQPPVQPPVQPPPAAAESQPPVQILSPAQVQPPAAAPAAKSQAPAQIQPPTVVEVQSPAPAASQPPVPAVISQTAAAAKRPATEDSDTTLPRKIYHYDFEHYPHYLYVYCDLVRPIIVSDTETQLLRVVKVPMPDEQHETACSSFSNLMYVPLMKNHFQTVEFDIRDQTGESVEFRAGTTIATLHFRKRGYF